MQLPAIGIDRIRGRAWIGTTGLDIGIVATSPDPEPSSAPGQFLWRVMGEVSGDAKLPHRIDWEARHITGLASGKQDRHE